MQQTTRVREMEEVVGFGRSACRWPVMRKHPCKMSLVACLLPDQSARVPWHEHDLQGIPERPDLVRGGPGLRLKSLIPPELSSQVRRRRDPSEGFLFCVANTLAIRSFHSHQRPILGLVSCRYFCPLASSRRRVGARVRTGSPNVSCRRHQLVRLTSSIIRIPLGWTGARPQRFSSRELREALASR